MHVFPSVHLHARAHRHPSCPSSSASATPGPKIAQGNFACLSIRPSPCPSASPPIASLVVCVCNSETENRTDCLRKFRERRKRAHRARARKVAATERAQAVRPRTPFGARGPVQCPVLRHVCPLRGEGGRCGRLQSAYIIIIAKRCENRKIPPDYVNSHTRRTSELAGGPQKLRTGPQNPLPEAAKHCFFTGKARCGRPQKKKKFLTCRSRGICHMPWRRLHPRPHVQLATCAHLSPALHLRLSLPFSAASLSRKLS